MGLRKIKKTHLRPRDALVARGCRSANKLLDVVLAESHVSVMSTAHGDLRVHVVVAGGPTVLVDVDQRSRNQEKRDHLIHAFVDDQRMDLARRLLDVASLAGDPVVLKVAPGPSDDVGMHRRRVAMPAQDTGPPHAQQIRPAAVDRVKE